MISVPKESFRHRKIKIIKKFKKVLTNVFSFAIIAKSFEFNIDKRV